MTSHIERLTSFDQIRLVCQDWARFQWFPEADPDFVPLIIESRKAALGPCVLALRQNGNAEALLIGRTEIGRLNTLPDFTDRFQPKLRLLEVLYGGMLGDWCEENANQFLLLLKAALARGEWQAVRFRMLNLKSPLWAQARQHFPWICRGAVGAPSLHWSLHLPRSCDELHRGLDGKTRKNLKRHIKLLQNEYEVLVKRLDQPGDCGTIVKTTDAILSKTYQQGFETSWVGEEMVKRVTLWLRKGCFRSFFLYADGKACAYQHVLKYRGRAYAMGTGYDPAFQRYGVGRYIQFKALEDLCKDGDVSELDFGFGDADYKRELCQSCQEEADLVLFSASLAGLFGNGMRTGEMRLFQALERLLKSSGTFAAVKKAWREGRRKSPPDGLASPGAESAVEAGEAQRSNHESLAA